MSTTSLPGGQLIHEVGLTKMAFFHDVTWNSKVFQNLHQPSGLHLASGPHFLFQKLLPSSTGTGQSLPWM